MLFDIVRWWLVLQALGLLALPITMWLFRRLPDRGYSFAKPFGLLLVGYGAWLCSMFGLGALGRVQLIMVALLVAAAGCGTQGRGGLRHALIDLRGRAAWIGFTEVVFAGTLYLGIWLRWHDFWGGGVAISHTEQPMDLTFISGILASQSFPPHDPWLSQYPINYYYLGYLFIAVLIRLANVGIGVGYTLGIATIFALAATGIAGLVRNLIDLSRSDAAGETPARPARSGVARIGAWVFPLVGVVLVLLVGNQVGALQLMAGSEKVVAVDPRQLPAVISNGLGARATLELAPSFPTDPGTFDSAQLVPADKAANFDTWWPSRAVWDDLTDAEGNQRRVYNITEFPLFSFLLGDLHPHVLSLPWTLLAIALSLNLLLRPAAPDFRAKRGWITLLLSAIILGGLYAINSWDLPTYLLLYLGAMVLLYLRLAPAPRHFFWAHFVQQAGLIILASYAVYLPFHMSFVAPTEGFPLGIAPARTGFVEFLVIFGLFFVPLFAFVLRSAGRPSEQAISGPATDQPALWPLTPIYTVLTLIILVLLGIAIGWPLFALLPLAMWACVAAYEQRGQPATSFALWLFALGALVIWGTDLIFLRDHFEGSLPRMNTIFKFYYQVWLLWGTLAAYALWVLVQRVRWRSLLWAVPFAALLLGAMVYPALAPADTADTSTIDGLAYLQRSAPGEAAAIEWIRQTLSGNTVVVQAPGDSYNSATARVASATGRPTVIGWPGAHEGLWRRGQPDVAAQISSRVQDITTLYTTTDQQLMQSLLERYNIEYVYVGAAERELATKQAAPPEALSKFDGALSRVFDQDGVVIYQYVR